MSRPLANSFQTFAFVTGAQDEWPSTTDLSAHMTVKILLKGSRMVGNLDERELMSAKAKHYPIWVCSVSLFSSFHVVEYPESEFGALRFQTLCYGT